MFVVVKRQWGFNKVRYKDLAKTATRAFVALGLANICVARSTWWDECVGWAPAWRLRPRKRARIA